MFGIPLPEDYVSFMSRCNGATLFDNSLFIYGVVTELSRSLSLEDQQPVSLAAELESSRWRHDPPYPWRPFGSVTGYEKLFELEIDASGRARMQCDGSPVRTANSVRDLIGALAACLDGLTDHRGFIDQSRKGMDAELMRFVESPD
jgi:hypothetical protein